MACVEGSPTAEKTGESTGVYKQEDLIPEFRRGNDKFFSRVIFAPNYDVASAFGYKAAMFNNYSMLDHVSICQEISFDDGLNGNSPYVIKVSMKEEE